MNREKIERILEQDLTCVKLKLACQPVNEDEKEVSISAVLGVADVCVLKKLESSYEPLYYRIGSWVRKTHPQLRFIETTNSVSIEEENVPSKTVDITYD